MIPTATEFFYLLLFFIIIYSFIIHTSYHVRPRLLHKMLWQSVHVLSNIANRETDRKKNRKTNKQTNVNATGSLIFLAEIITVCLR